MKHWENMRYTVKSFFPISLKNKIFLAVLLLVLLPLFLLFLYIFNEIEESMKDTTTQQAHFEIQNLNQKFGTLLSTVMQSFILLNKDASITSTFENPYKDSPLESQKNIEDKLKNIDSSIFLYNSPQVFYTLADLQGNIYTSYRPKQPLDYADFMEQLPFEAAITNYKNHPFTWIIEPNYVHYDYTNSTRLLSLYAVLADEQQQVYGIARIGIDYTMWFNAQLKGSTLFQDFSIVSSKKDVVYTFSKPDPSLLTDSIINSLQKTDGYMTEQDRILNYSYVSDLDWYLVNRIALDQLFADIYAVKQRFLIIYLSFMVALVLVMFLISSSITRPLNKLRKHVLEMNQTDMSANLPENEYKGEMLDLTKGFNKMALDINAMVKRLSEEKLQKEAIRFKMLLFQMNPHFLLNTLNTVKFIAWKQKNKEISEICVALGSLLETSLNSDIELIHLKDELQLIESYLYILKFRFEDRFDVRFELGEPVLQYALVPKISLQPLVENAVQHGFRNLDKGGLIVIRAYSKDKRLWIEVEDNGEGAQEHKEKEESKRPRGIGIGNLRERLDIIFPNNAELRMEPLTKGTKVQYSIPLMLSIPNQLEEQ